MANGKRAMVMRSGWLAGWLRKKKEENDKQIRTRNEKCVNNRLPRDQILALASKMSDEEYRHLLGGCQ